MRTTRQYAAGKKVHKISYIGQRRRESSCGKVWYSDWIWQPRASANWSLVTCGNCLRGRPTTSSWISNEEVAAARAVLMKQVNLHAVNFINIYALLIHAKACTNKHQVDDGAGHMMWEYCGTNYWYCKDAPPTDG